jgi:DNA-nicking Smr family endonuclease
LRGLLKNTQLEKPAPEPEKKKEKRPDPKPAPVPVSGRPSDGLRGDDRIAFHDAMGGVRPVKGAPRAVTTPKITAPKIPKPSDDEARARLGALVAGSVQFEIVRDSERVRAVRKGSTPAILRSLASREVRPDATLDLHGMRAEEAEAAIAKFVRAQHRKGLRRLCIVHGKGLHSEGGVGVLGQSAVRALTEGGAAPLVVAFSTAHAEHGGSGALIVELAKN